MMAIGFATMKRLMQSATALPISDMAIYVMIHHIEAHVKQMTEESEKVHSKWNELRELQAIYRKKKISAEEVNEAISGGKKDV